MPITIVLADGFDDHDVELVTNGEPYLVENASTSLLTGIAAEIGVDAPGTAEVSARIVRGHGAKADPQPDDVLPEHRQDDRPAPTPDQPPLASFEVPDGATLVLSYDERGLSGTVHTEPVLFG